MNRVNFITFLFAISSIFVLACNSGRENTENTEHQEYKLVHTVIFKLKETTTEEEKAVFVKELESLSSIEQTRNLFVSQYTQTDDPRARKDYDVILQMQFASKDDLKAYSGNKFHLQVREKIGKYVAQVPIVYDSDIE